MKAYHTFLLVKTDQGCHIITEEVVRGEGAIKFRQEQPNAMHEGHDLWLKRNQYGYTQGRGKWVS
jgi:hypothetical protein